MSLSTATTASSRSPLARRGDHGDGAAPAVAEIVDIAEKLAGPIVHLRVLPGVIKDYEALVRRAITPP